jgi:hypothetical protein
VAWVRPFHSEWTASTKREYKTRRLGQEKLCFFSWLRREAQFPLDRTTKKLMQTSELASIPGGGVQQLEMRARKAYLALHQYALCAPIPAPSVGERLSSTSSALNFGVSLRWPN